MGFSSLLFQKNRVRSIMRKKKIFAVAAIMAMAVFAAACGKKAEEGNKASASNVSGSEIAGADEASPSTLTADSPEIQELENMTVPDEPKVSEMGKITLPDLSTISVTVAPMENVTQEEVDAAISQVLAENLTTVDEASKEGDTVNIDYSGSIDGVKFDGGTAEKQDLKLGSGRFIPGFEDQLIGKKAGETVTVKVTFPEQYGNTDLAGKAAEFEVKVNEVKREPALTDEWVKNYEGTKAETVAAYRDQIREQLQNRKAFNYHSAIQDQAIQQISEKTEVELSKKFLDYAKAYILNAQLGQYKQYGMSAADVINMSGKTVEQFKEDAYANAEAYAKQLFIMRKLADEQNIRATDELLDNLAKAESSLTGEETNRIKLIEQYGKELVEEAAIRNAVMEYVESQIKVTEEELPFETQMDLGKNSGSNTAESSTEETTEAAR